MTIDVDSYISSLEALQKDQEALAEKVYNHPLMTLARHLHKTYCSESGLYCKWSDGEGDCRVQDNEDWVKDAIELIRVFPTIFSEFSNVTTPRTRGKRKLQLEDK